MPGSEPGQPAGQAVVERSEGPAAKAAKGGKLMRTLLMQRGRRWRHRVLGAVALVALVLTGRSQGGELHGMIRIQVQESVIGTSTATREDLGRRFNCHPSWLGDDLPERPVAPGSFWIDRHPVTNAQYLAFVEATGHSRPPWWGHWGGRFPDGYEDHPVVGISGLDAVAFARWAGKRLPTAEEWEVAVGHPERTLFAWGDAWPGPLERVRQSRVFWELPGTCAVGSGTRGCSVWGIEDFAGQAIEWVADVRPHHGVTFQLWKGASWFHEDPLSFRTAAGGWAHEGWRSAFSGLRCALDGEEDPPPVLRSETASGIRVEAARQQLLADRVNGEIRLSAGSDRSRHLTIHVPAWGRERISLTAPETVLWNGEGVMTWRLTPDLTWTVRTPARAAYEMRLRELRIEAEFLVEEDRVEQRFTAVNLTPEAASFRTSSCFDLQSHPQFYDAELLRTFVLTDTGFEPLRRLSRGSPCVRWITGPRLEELGADLERVVLAVLSRDGRQVIGSGRRVGDAGCSVANNTLFTCLHSDSAVIVPAAGRTTTQQFFWFLDGGLAELHARMARDL